MSKDLPSLYRQYLEKPEFRALLETVSYAEGTPGQSGYRVMYGGKKFNDFSRHPDVVNRGGGYSSSAAGKYQFLTPTWNGAKQRLGLPDFGPQSQDLAALDLMRGRVGGGLAAIEQQLKQGNLQGVVNKLAPVWASLPTKNGTSYYGQPVKDLKTLQNVYQQNLNKFGAQATAAPPVNPPTQAAATPANPAQQPGNIAVNLVLGNDPELLKRLGIKPQANEQGQKPEESFLDTYVNNLIGGLFKDLFSPMPESTGNPFLPNDAPA